MLTANDIRRRFINFFAQHDHEIVRSSSLIPKDDPSLLFTNAGMVQFKAVFQGLEKTDYTRATTVQKCLRVGGKHNDLENVGRTARHHTFFEMLGNFSFGDYFKEKAIELAWLFVTQELSLPKEKLYVTVFEDDDESASLWEKIAKLEKARIIRMGEKDNFWSMGDTGPCGPCSEIYYDQGQRMSCGPECGIGKCDCDRYLEIWNLVFMQYNQIAPGQREPLPCPSIDTGMGLERVAAVCQGVFSNYDNDLFKGLINVACSLANVSYSKSMPDTNDIDTALRVIADHSRSLAFMVADGIMPSNEGRGYVLRRLIRRAYRFGRLIGMPQTFLYKTALAVVDLMGQDFPELVASKDFMARVIKEEEERFDATLDKGLVLLEEVMANLANNNSTAISGDIAFRLYDTYGFPLDIINDIAEKQGFSVDEKGFSLCMQEQKARAKAAWKGSGETNIAQRFAALLEDGIRSEFTGYETLAGESRVIALLTHDGELVKKLAEEESGYIVTGTTPFYGASGGQSGDTGRIATILGSARVADTLKPSNDLIAHQVVVTKGSILLDAEASLLVDEGPRIASARNHTCTHLLHAALQKVLGNHARQAGSLVTPDRLRFDFTHISPMTAEEVNKVETLVNEAIFANIPLNIRHMSYDAAIADGVTALFGEKYAENVRVVQIPGASAELCGGTHLQSTAQAGFFAIVSESSVAAGVRRIEAVTGLEALRLFNQYRSELLEVQQVLKARSSESVKRIEAMQNELKALKKEIQKSAAQANSKQGHDLMNSIETIGGIKVLAEHMGTANLKVLRELMDDVRSKLSSGIVCLAAEENGKVHVVLAVSKDLHDKFTAPHLIKQIAPAIAGSGGGRPDMAQAGGTNPAGIKDALSQLRDLIL